MKKIYINISFDDLHPENGWGNLGDDILSSLFYVQDIFPDIKFTFFSTPNFQSKYEKKLISFFKRRLHLLGIKIPFFSFSQYEQSPFLFSKHKKWCDFIKKAIKSNFFEICIHGYTHYSPYIIPSAEFYNISEQENIQKIQMAMDEIKNNNIPFSFAFRPPAWGVNSTLKKVLINMGFKYLSLDPKSTKLEYDQKNNIFNIPQHYSIESNDYTYVFNYLKHNNFLFIKGHLFQKIENGIREEAIMNLLNLLKELSKEYYLHFIFIEEIEKLYLDNKLSYVYKV